MKHLHVLIALVAVLIAAVAPAHALPAPIIVDNTDPGFSASENWSTTTIIPGYYGTNYHWRYCEPVHDPATWTFTVPTTANYKVYAWWPQYYYHSPTAPYIIYDSGGSKVVYVNQQINGAQWRLLGTFHMNAGTNRIQLSCWTNPGYVVIADAVKISR